MRDIDYLTKQIQESIDNGKFINAICGSDHTQCKHINKHNEYLIDRLIQDDKKSVSSFFTEDTANTILEELLYYRAANIAEWLINSTTINQRAFTANFPNEDYDDGLGVIYHKNSHGKIQKYKPNSCKVVLEYNPHWTEHTRLVSAFPLYDEYTEPCPSDASILTDMRKTETYKNSTVLEKLQLESLCDPRLPVCNLNHNHSVLFMDYKENKRSDKKHIFTFTETDICHFMRTTDKIGLVLKHPYKNELNIKTKSDTLSLIQYPELKEKLQSNIPKAMTATNIIWNRIQELHHTDTNHELKKVSTLENTQNHHSPNISHSPDFG